MLNSNDLWLTIDQSIRQYPECTALCINGEKYSYSDLDRGSYVVAKSISEHSGVNQIAIFCDHDVLTYISILGAVRSNYAYIPLNASFPDEKIKRIIDKSNIKLIICSENNSNRVMDIVGHDKLTVISAKPINSCTDIEISTIIDNTSNFPVVNVDSTAYVMFTSGTTGAPKGIPISYDNLLSYLDSVKPISQVSNESKMTQMFELSFDLSVHDMFVCWSSGASLYVPSQQEKFLPDVFIKSNEITHWFSVPSVGNYLRVFDRLKENAFPSLKNVLFCGEALTSDLTKMWIKASPNANLYNLYGPTEATIAISYFEVTHSFLLNWNKNFVPIGQPFKNNELKLCSEFNEDSSGELILSGPQVCSGYLDDPEITKKVFFKEKSVNNYKTGDLVDFDDRYGFMYLGRKDRQVKVNGFRVELGEIESTIEKYLTSSICACTYVNEKLSLFFECLSTDTKEIAVLCAKHLPSYMVPSDFIKVDKIPLNANGKKDYSSLTY